MRQIFMQDIWDHNRKLLWIGVALIALVVSHWMTWKQGKNAGYILGCQQCEIFFICEPKQFANAAKADQKELYDQLYGAERNQKTVVIEQ